MGKLLAPRCDEHGAPRRLARFEGGDVHARDLKLSAATRLLLSVVEGDPLPEATRQRLSDLAFELDFIRDALAKFQPEGGLDERPAAE